MYHYNYGNLPESFIGTWNGNDPINFQYLADHPLISLPKIWNHLSSDLKTTVPKGAFKSKLKAYFFQDLLDALP